MVHPGLIYVYAVDRDDEFKFAANRFFGGRVGIIALFTQKFDAQNFAYAVSENDGSIVDILPSAQ